MLFMKMLLPIFSASIVLAAPISSVYQQKCGSCHGQKGEKVAMGKSEAIKGMSVAKIEKTLHDYASGEKKTLPVVKTMKKNFLDANSKEQVRALAEYINCL